MRETVEPWRCGWRSAFFSGLLAFLAATLATSVFASAADIAGAYQPKTVGEVTINDPFWSPKLQTYRDASLPSAWQYNLGALNELQQCANRAGPGVESVPWTEANLHAVLEAASYALAQWPNQPDNVVQPTSGPAIPTYTSLDARMDAIVALLHSAQATTDGYLHAYVTNHAGQMQWGEYPIAPWARESLFTQCDGFTAGHLLEAAVAHYQATQKTAFLDIAKKVADQAYAHFVVEQNPGFCGHAQFEPALVELYRVTGESRYLQLSQYFVDQRGQAPSANGESTTLAAYFQDDLPISRQTAINGHAVRAAFFYTGGG